MGLTSALNTSLNGLSLNETLIDVVGNNISNAGTNGFKASEVVFATQLSRTLSVGSSPNAQNGGTNPRQIGLGATTAQIRHDFNQGSITNTTSPSDLAIQGDGFFVVDNGDGPQYTRAGNFNLNSNDILVSAGGLAVQGYGVDADFNLITTNLVDLSIPLGDLNVAAATSQATVTGALYAAGDLATTGSVFQTPQLYNLAGDAISTGASTNLVDLRTTTTGGSSIFTAGDVVSFSAQKGGRTLDSATLTVSASTSVTDLLSFMNQQLGINPNASDGAALTIAGGQISITGNKGEINDINFLPGGLVLNPGTTTSNTSLLGFQKTNSADGESSITDLVFYDSLGQEARVKLTTALVKQDSSSSTFQYFIEQPLEDGSTALIGTGQLVFDTEGSILGTPTATVTIPRTNQGANDIVATIDFSKVSGISTAQAGSALLLQNQDGSAPGNLTTYVIAEGGQINGIFDNGIIRTLGQVVVARFSNPQGLLESGETNFRQGIGSGAPFITTPGSFGTGTIRSGAIELSNTDIGKNLVELITASTNYRGNARVIDSIQQLVDELLVLGR